MKELKISIYKKKAPTPDTTIKIPLSSLKIVDALIPKKVKEKMVSEGVELQAILKAAETTDVTGKLVEIQDKDEYIVISAE